VKASEHIKPVQTIPCSTCMHMQLVFAVSAPQQRTPLLPNASEYVREVWCTYWAAAPFANIIVGDCMQLEKKTLIHICAPLAASKSAQALSCGRKSVASCGTGRPAARSAA